MADGRGGRGRAVDRDRLGRATPRTGRHRPGWPRSCSARGWRWRSPGGQLGGSSARARASGTRRAGAGRGRAPGRRWPDVPRRAAARRCRERAVDRRSPGAGQAARACSRSRPLVGLGRISYGVYLFHWPIYVILDEARTDLSGPALLGLRLAVTRSRRHVVVRVDRAPDPARRLAAAPDPRRFARRHVGGRRGGGRRPGDDRRRLLAGGAGRHRGAGRHGVDDPAVGAASSLATVESTVATRSAATSVAGIGRADGSAASASGVERPATVTTTLPDATAASRRRPGRCACSWSATRRPKRSASGSPDGPAPTRRSPTSAWRCRPVAASCVAARSRPTATCRSLSAATRSSSDVLPDTLVEFRPEVVMLLCTTARPGRSAVVGRGGHHRSLRRARISSGSTTTTRGSPSWSRHRVRPRVFVRGPLVDPFWLGRETMSELPRATRHRRRRDGSDWRRQAAAVQVLDLRAWVEANGIAASHDARPDGMHWTPEAAFELTDRWLGPTLLSIARPS